MEDNMRGFRHLPSSKQHNIKTIKLLLRELATNKIQVPKQMDVPGMFAKPSI